MEKMNPTKITHLIVGLDVGGAERFLCRLIGMHQGTPQYEHRVISLTSKGVLGPTLEASGIPVTALGMRSLRDVPRTYFRLKAVLRRDLPDVLQCWMYYADLLGGIAGKRLGIPTILWGIRNSHFEAGGTRLKRAIRKVCAALSHSLPTKVVCVAESARDVHAQAGYRRDAMIVIHNGYDPAGFVYSETGRHELRKQLELSQDHVLIGSVGRYSAAKDQASFIKAAAIVGRHQANTHFLLVGRDLTEQNQTITALIAGTGFPERFTLLGERSDVAACMSAMDIFCLHSKTEGFPNVLGEAMCIGLPCVATDVGDAKVLLGDTGMVVSKDNSAELAAALGSMAALSPDELKAMGQRARQRIQSNFTLEHAVRKFEALYGQQA